MAAREQRLAWDQQNFPRPQPYIPWPIRTPSFTLNANPRMLGAAQHDFSPTVSRRWFELQSQARCGLCRTNHRSCFIDSNNGLQHCRTCPSSAVCTFSRILTTQAHANRFPLNELLGPHPLPSVIVTDDIRSIFGYPIPAFRQTLRPHRIRQLAGGMECLKCVRDARRCLIDVERLQKCAVCLSDHERFFRRSTERKMPPHAFTLDELVGKDMRAVTRVVVLTDAGGNME